MSTSATISPAEEDLTRQLKSLRESHPTTGVAKLLHLLREAQPEWSVSEKRLKKVLHQEGLMISSSGTVDTTGAKDGTEKTSDEQGVAASAAAKGKKSGKGGGGKKRRPAYLDYPVSSSSTESHLDPNKWTAKAAVRRFDPVKGKGLVAAAHIEEGETVWKEDPWVMTADWAVYSGTVAGDVCAHCSCPLSLRNPTSIFPCPSCSTSTTTATTANRYCNRLCYTRAQASYHPFLCEGQNPACAPLLALLRKNEWAAPHALARATGKMMAAWRNEATATATTKTTGGSSGGEWEKEWAFFDALAGWTMEDKYRTQGKEVTAEHRELWRTAFECYVQTFHQPPTAEGRNKLQHVMRRKTLPQEVVSKLFTYDAFMLNTGKMDVNRESHGGLYQLHSHMNHSCRPNLSVLHIDVPGARQPHLPNSPPPYTGTPVPARLTILARRPIPPGEELTVSYVSPLLGVAERRRELRQWGIAHCQCPRCMEEETGEGKPDGKPALVEEHKRQLGDLEEELRKSFGFGL